MSRGKSIAWVSGLLAVGLVVGGAASPALAGTASGMFLRGDANGSGNVDIADAIATLAYLFSAGTAPGCLDAADVNDDGVVNLADPVSALAYLFSGGSVPIAPPFPDPGYDPTGDAFACAIVECISGAQLETEIALGSLSVPVPTTAQTWSPSVLGVGLLDVTFNLNNSIPAQFGDMTYSPLTGNVTMASSTFPVGGSLVIDGPLILDFDCTATVTVGVSGSILLEQSQVSSELILVSGVEETNVNLTLQGISLASCGLTGLIFDAVYPLISGYLNGIINGAMENGVGAALENYVLQALIDNYEPEYNAVPVCAP